MFEKVKLSKRQIKEDKFTTFMLSSKQQLENNWQYYAIGVIVVVLAVVGIIYYLNSQQESSTLAATQLAQANMQYRQGNSQVAILTLADILTKYGGSQFAEQATYMLGKINLETRNYEEAKLHFNTYLEKYKNDKLIRPAAMLGLAVTYENQGQYAEAAAQFEKTIQEFPESPQLPELHLGAMRNHLLARQDAKAREHFEIISEKFKGTETANAAARLFYEKSQSPS
jgi:TolA-binding protein